MTDAFDPLAPRVLVVNSDGQEAEARLLSGQVLTGRVSQLHSGNADFSLLIESIDATIRIPLNSLASLLFTATMRDEDIRLFLSRGHVQITPRPENFSISLINSEELSGIARCLIHDRDGLHALVINGNEIRQLFVPITSMHDYRIEAGFGEMLIDECGLDPLLVEKAGQTQMVLRDKRIGEYLTPLFRADELKKVLSAQPNYPLQRMGDMLVNEGIISRIQLDNAVIAQENDRKKRIGDILVETGAVSREIINATLAKRLGIPTVEIRSFDIDPEASKLVSRDVAQKHTLFPFLLHDGYLVCAVDNPMDIDTLRMLRFITDYPIQMVIAKREDIEWAIKSYYFPPEPAIAPIALSASADEARDAQEMNALEIARLAEEKPVVKFVNDFLLDALKRGASDIHIHPGEQQVDLFYRIDGLLIKMRSFSKQWLAAAVSRIKITGNLNIAERRIPQDGRAKLIFEDKAVDLRISIIPTLSGESVAIRIIDTGAGIKSISTMGFSSLDEKILKDLLHRNNGIILVTGPTGSGKSTTLYAALGEVMKRNVNIITVEDPVEFQVEAIKQIQVNQGAGFTFAVALKHILRHDPDVIMIGEIRDHETAKIAIESAMTGHLVLSTLHTNSAASAIARLMEMGLESYQLSSSVLGVLAQRLVRRNCPRCLSVEKVDPVMREMLDVRPDEVFYRGTGCDHCNDTGYSGRMAVYELLLISPALRAAIRPGVSADEIQHAAIGQGMVTLSANALAAARQRKTSLSEVYRVRLE